MKLNERKLTKAEVSKREDIIMDMKKNKRELTKRYGKDAEKVMYGRATNLAKKQLENMDPKSKLREMIKTALSSPKPTNEKFSKKYDDDPALKGGQKNLPDALQKSIIDEIEVDDSYSERETMGMEYNQNPEKFLDSIVSILNRFSNGGKFNSSNVDSNYLNTFELEGSPLKVGLNKEFSFDLLSGEKILMSNENLDTILLASEKHSSLKEASEDQYPSFEVDKNIRYQDMNISSGYWTYTGKESGGRGVYLNVMTQQRLAFNKDDINFFKTKLPNHFKLAEASENQSGEGFRVEYKTQDGENAKSRIYKTKEEAEKKEAELVDKSRIKQAKIVSVDSGLKEDLDLGHQDDEPHMLKANLYRIGKYAMELYQMMDKFEGQGEVDLPHWWQSKIIKSESMITSAKHYLDFELKEPEIDAMVDVASEEGAISENKDKELEELELDLYNIFLSKYPNPGARDSILVPLYAKYKRKGGKKELGTIWDAADKRTPLSEEGAISEIDNNDPILMKMRAAKDKKKDFGSEYGNAVQKAYKGKNNDAQISSLERKRNQLMRDMEQEAEPEGGPIADRYGRELNKIDAKISKLRGKPLTYDQAISKNESKYSQLAEKIAKNLKESKFQRVKKKDIYDRFLDNPENPRGRAKIIIDKFIKEYGVDASQMAVEVFSNRNNLKPEEKYILKYITKDEVQISSQPGGPDFSSLNEAIYTDPNTGKSYDLQYVSSKNRWELDVMKKGASIYSNAITTIKRKTVEEIIDWLEGYNIDSSWVKNSLKKSK